MPFELTKKICDLLIRKGLVSGSELDGARRTLSEKGGSLTDILVGMKAISKEDLFAALSEELGIPPINLSNLRIDDEVLRLIPKRISKTYRILPISRMNRQLTVAMVDPLNIIAIDDLKILTNMDISPVLASEDDMKDALRKYWEDTAGEEISNIVADIESVQMEMISEKEDISSSELLSITAEAPIVKLANMILSKGVKENASDILIEPMEKDFRVRYRVDGMLYISYELPKKFHEALVSRLKVVADLDIAERRLPQDGRFMLRVEDRKVDFRISVVPSSFGEKVALRVLDKGQARIDLETLGFKERDVRKIRSASEKPHGMILICGPTGSGKTTTLYSILKHIDDPGKNIITVEDPVEFEQKGINQVSIHDAIGLSFSACLRAILRQDPDIIMVGEIRDFDTLDIAIKSALTGHLVISTIHTNTAAGSVVRMVNMGIEPFLIASSVDLVAAQRLIRKLCPDCKKPYLPEKEVADKYGIYDKDGNIARIYKPVGCKACRDSGYRGRVGIIECLELTPAIKDLIFAQAQTREIEEAARKEGLITLRENGIENVLEGVTSLEDVLRLTVGIGETG
ncbi:MAG: ATPase, T2SS/T4P/T4SS family [Candidatus Omnitrophota bacterium]